MFHFFSAGTLALRGISYTRRLVASALICSSILVGTLPTAEGQAPIPDTDQEVLSTEATEATDPTASPAEDFFPGETLPDPIQPVDPSVPSGDNGDLADPFLALGGIDTEMDAEDFSDLFMYENGFSNILPETESVREGQIKIACVGDSITYGCGLMNWSTSHYPLLLQNKLGYSYHVQNFGGNNRCVQDTANKPYTELTRYTQSLEYDADIVVFMMGTNDSKEMNWTDPDAFKSALCSLLDSYGDAQIILCTPATCFILDGESEAYYGIQPEIVDQIAQIIRDVAAERNYTLVDIHALTGDNPQWFGIDGVHPNNEGAAAIADAVYSAVSQSVVVK